MKRSVVAWRSIQQGNYIWLLVDFCRLPRWDREWSQCWILRGYCSYRIDNRLVIFLRIRDKSLLKSCVSDRRVGYYKKCKPPLILKCATMADSPNVGTVYAKPKLFWCSRKVHGNFWLLKVLFIRHVCWFTICEMSSFLWKFSNFL